MGLEDDASFAEEVIFRLREALVGDDLAQDSIGREAFRLELGEGLVEFFGKGG